MSERKNKEKRYSIFRSTIFRMIAVILVIVLPINIMTIAFSTYIVSQSQDQLDKEIQNSLDIASSNLASSLKRCTRQMTYLSLGDKDFLVMGNSTWLDNNFASSYRAVADRMEDLKQAYDLIDVVYFSFPVTEYMLTEGYPGMSAPKFRSAIKDTMNLLADEQIWEVKDIDGNVVLVSYDCWKNIGYGVLLNLERTLNKLSVNQSKDKTIFFMNKDASVFSLNGRIYMEEQGKTFEEIQKSDDYYVYTSVLDDYDLALVEIVDKDQKMASMPKMLVYMQILSVVLAVIVIPLLLFYVSRLVNRPIRRLVRAIDTIEQGDLEHRIEEHTGSNEFEQINRSFNSMMDQVQKLKIDVYEKELEKKDIKMRYLSQQIQPHFMLNAMNLLYSYEPEEYPLIQKMILCISKYYRYIVKTKSDYVQLQQEMTHIKNYFEIQKARFPGLFYSIVEWDENLSKAMLPPLIIQNFAENSIKHSLKIGNKITIFVVADFYKEAGHPDKMRIRLADTGEGISDELIEKIELFKKTGVHQDGLGVGIENTIERLKHLHCDRSTVRLWRDEHYGGTNVEIICPIFFEGDSL